MTMSGNGKVAMTEVLKCDQCRHPALCRAQGEGFCLREFNDQRHQEYRKRRAEARAGAAKETEN
jgi:hypothetical protein